MNKDYFLPSSLERHVRLLAATPLFASRNKNKNRELGIRFQGTENDSDIRIAFSNPYVLIPNPYSFGFTLIEVMIYIAILGMIVVTLVSLAYTSARENQETTNSVINAYEK